MPISRPKIKIALGIAIVVMGTTLPLPLAVGLMIAGAILIYIGFKTKS